MMLIVAKTLFAVIGIVVALILILQIVWCIMVNVIGKKDFDPFKRLRIRKQCRNCLNTFKTAVPVGEFGNACPKCKATNDYEII